MVVQHNISGMNANRQLNITTGIQAKSSEKLSSGYRINRAADDAAGLAISEKMRRQIRGLTQASNNAQDGVSWCQIADGALDEVSNMIQRAKELAVKAANDTLQDEDRSYINEEMQKMAAEIDRTHSSTEFNNIHIFSNDGYAPNEAYISDPNRLELKLPGGRTIGITCSFIGSDGQLVEKVDGSQASGNPNSSSVANSGLASFAQGAAALAVSKLADKFDDLFAAASSKEINIGLKLANIDGSASDRNTLAVARLALRGSTDSTIMSYQMNIDTSDFPIDKFSSMSDAKKANLAAVIAHEMTHLVMYDTVTDGMLDNKTTSYPSWFAEGMAQTSSGDNGWVSNHLQPGASDSQIKEYMKNTKYRDYGAGYLATMYLGYTVAKHDDSITTEISSSSIAAGLDKLLTYLATNKGKTLSDAINTLTEGEYTSQANFESKVFGGDSGSVTFIKGLLDARGTNGAGSLLGALSDSETTIFGGAASTSSGDYYRVQTDNMWYANAFGSGYVFPDDSEEIDTLGKSLKLQVGSETDSQNQIELKRFDVRLNALTEGGTWDTTSRELALETIETVNVAGRNVAQVRSYYGALQNRLEHTIKNLDNVVENTQAAESRIRDTDMAAEMVKYSNNNILAQAGQSMLAQANQTNQGVLSLLQ